MWYTANLSFSQFMKEQVTLYGQQLTLQKINYESFINNATNYSGTFTNVEIANEYGQIIHIAQIAYQVDKKSVKKPIIVLETLSITDIKINAANKGFDELLQHISNEIDKKGEQLLPNIAINNIVVINTKNNQQKTITLANGKNNTDIIKTIGLLLQTLLLTH